MKVKLTLSKDTVICIANMLSRLYELPVSNIQRENVYKSIGFDLADKFDTKARTLKKSADLLNAKKKAQVTLKFHEAWALHEIIHDLLEITPLNEYDQNLISLLLQQIHPKII